MAKMGRRLWQCSDSTVRHEMPSLAALKSLRVFDVDYAYLDSGQPTSANYTTWVFIHGFGFNGGSIPIFSL